MSGLAGVGDVVKGKRSEGGGKDHNQFGGDGWEFYGL